MNRRSTLERLGRFERQFGSRLKRAGTPRWLIKSPYGFRELFGIRYQISGIASLQPTDINAVPAPSRLDELERLALLRATGRAYRRSLAHDPFSRQCVITPWRSRVSGLRYSAPPCPTLFHAILETTRWRDAVFSLDVHGFMRSQHLRHFSYDILTILLCRDALVRWLHRDWSDSRRFSNQHPLAGADGLDIRPGRLVMTVTSFHETSLERVDV